MRQFLPNLVDLLPARRESPDHAGMRMNAHAQQALIRIAPAAMQHAILAFKFHVSGDADDRPVR
ncbi:MULTISPECIES: hypothetical protein [Xanthomonas]|uniref:hypothetical protein n=1 Tax=Xanthomonas TaxID=338 RepID=UPI0012646C90|nr:MULTISPECIES: hypothetical protein [Xanthomonas]KAB7781762.1 hypothetical protein CEK66_00085 [Xanthomonas sp. LMG 12460]MDY4294506.1 hypothetical protein [Xanthomonas sp. LF02-5]MDY4356996.1 hypothetical protein [Xanthomonas sp. LF04-12]